MQRATFFVVDFEVAPQLKMQLLIKQMTKHVNISELTRIAIFIGSRRRGVFMVSLLNLHESKRHLLLNDLHYFAYTIAKA